MFPQSSLGEQVPMDPFMTFNGVYLAQVYEVIPSDAAVRVLTTRGSIVGLRATGRLPDGSAENVGLKVKVMQHRAGPYVGDLDLPRPGDWGLVVFPNGSEQIGVWLGSLYRDYDNLATGNLGERISHHDSGVYTRIAPDGTTELSHPSGTFVRMGSGVALDQRTLTQGGGSFISPEGRVIETKRSLPYAIPTRPAITLLIKHSSGTLIDIDPTGNVTVTGVGTKQETIAGAVTEDYQGTKAETVVGALTETYQATKGETVQGNVTENYEQAWSMTVGQNGQITVTGSLVIQANDVTIESSNANPGAHMHLGGTAQEDFITKKAALDLITSIFNAHVHIDPQGGNTGAPTSSLSFTQGPHYSANTKAS